MTNKTREDSWQENDDLVLAQTVISHIRTGGTQLAAFEVAAEKLKRTAAACGFRWNSTVRKGYEREIREVKLNRSNKKVKAAEAEQHVYVSVTRDSTLSSINSFDEAMSTIINISKSQLGEFQKLIEENALLKKEVVKLKEQIESLKTPETTAKEDMQAFLNIMERARGLTHQ